MRKSVLFLVSEDWYFLSHRLDLARYFKQSGYHVLVACSVNRGRDTIEQEGFQLIDLNFDREKISLGFVARSIFDVTSHYRHYKPDVVVHVSLVMALIGSCAGLLARVPRIINILTGLGFIFVSEDKKTRLLRRMIRGAFKIFARFKRICLIVQNRDDLELFESMDFKVNQSVHLIAGSGVDSEAFTPAKPEDPRPYDVTFVGRLLFAKGVKELVEAARLLKDRGRDFKIVLIGKPDPGNPQSVSNDQIEHWQKEQLVTFLGHQTDIAAFYQKSKIAILPSWREGLPKSLLEAAACGLPLIATDVPGCREIVRAPDNGLLVTLQSPQAIAEAIETLMDDKLLRDRMGQKSRQIIAEELNSNVITKKTYDLITHV